MKLYKPQVDPVYNAHFVSADEVIYEGSCKVCHSMLHMVRNEYPTLVWTYGKPKDFAYGPLWIGKSRVVDTLVAEFPELHSREAIHNQVRETPHSPRLASMKVHIYAQSKPKLKVFFVDKQIVFSNRGTVRVTEPCPSCGVQYYKISGIQKRDSYMNGLELKILGERQPGDGVLVTRKELGGAHFFVYTQALGPNNYIFRETICTEHAKQFIEAQGWTGLYFLECGEVID